MAHLIPPEVSSNITKYNRFMEQPITVTNFTQLVKQKFIPENQPPWYYILAINDIIRSKINTINLDVRNVCYITIEEQTIIENAAIIANKIGIEPVELDETIFKSIFSHYTIAGWEIDRASSYIFFKYKLSF
jgi:hypothetical protein